MKRKILIIATLYSHIAQFHKPLINELKKNNFEVHIMGKNNLNEKDGLRLDEPNYKHELNISRNPLAFSNFSSFLSFCKILISEKYEIVLCNTPTGGIFGRLAKLFLFNRIHFKCYYIVHGFHFYKGASLMKWLFYFPIEYLLSFFTDKIITINDEDYNFAKKVFKCSIFKINGMGVDSNRFLKIDKSKLKKFQTNSDFDHKYFKIITVGELNNNKNQITILKALNLIKDEVLKIKYFVLGNGPEMKTLKKFVEKHNLSLIVKFLGYKKNIEYYIASSDLLISASEREGLGLNVIEGMLLKKPLLLSMNRGHNELVKHKNNGFLVENCKNFNKFAEYIKFYYYNRHLKLKFGRNSFKYSIKYTSINVMKNLLPIVLD